MTSTNHTPNLPKWTKPDTAFTLDVPYDLVRDLRPAARAHHTSVDRLILDLLLVLPVEPGLTHAIFDGS
jgi:hypothetical protein